jgi:hypothetical protein
MCHVDPPTLMYPDCTAAALQQQPLLGILFSLLYVHGLCLRMASFWATFRNDEDGVCGGVVASSVWCGGIVKLVVWIGVALKDSVN